MTVGPKFNNYSSKMGNAPKYKEPNKKIDPAAIPALQARIGELENSLAWYQMMDAMSSDHVVELTEKLEAAEAKLTKAVEALRFYTHDYVHSGSKARTTLAELEGK
jgi:hypothetical protein